MGCGSSKDAEGKYALGTGAGMCRVAQGWSTMLTHEGRLVRVARQQFRWRSFEGGKKRERQLDPSSCMSNPSMAGLQDLPAATELQAWLQLDRAAFLDSKHHVNIGEGLFGLVYESQMLTVTPAPHARL